ncbi:MAG: hypothetical protein M1814_002920 [Vezdaea aestivalis]|nr:MAG: hypothetical protein M1814_002920 [Vezdaea aestivalis]
MSKRKASSMDEKAGPISSVSYEDIAAIQAQFMVAEMEALKHEARIFAPAYSARSALVSKIPNFWALVLEGAGPEISEYILPSDFAALTTLTEISVSRFEIPPASPNGTGSPRSVEISFKFPDNEWMRECTLVKKFWYRKNRAGWAGLVSEPVEVPWKEGKDLTRGQGELVMKALREEGSGKTVEKEKLKKRIVKGAAGAESFFNWFYHRGRQVSAEEHERAKKEPKEEGEEVDQREARAEADLEELDVFPDGGKLAIIISEDLWPNAIDHYMAGEVDSDIDSISSPTSSQLEDHGSTSDEEDAPLLVDKSEGEDPSGRPKKKSKAL